MMQSKQRAADMAATRVSRKDTRSCALPTLLLAREKTAEVVIWNMGVVLAAALGFALTVNMALFALHIQ